MAFTRIGWRRPGRISARCDDDARAIRLDDERRRAVTTYRLAVAGRLPESAVAWLADLGATPVGTTSTVSTLEVHDQSALVGLVNRLHGLGVVIEEVVRVP